MVFNYGLPTTTTAAEVSRNFGRWQDQAIHGPVIVTHHGRTRVVLVSAGEYERCNAIKDAEPGVSAEADKAEDGRLEALLSHTRDGFIALNREMVVTAVNRVAEDFYGVSRAKLVGAPLAKTFPRLAGGAILERMRRVAVTGQADQFESRSTLFPDRHIRSQFFPYGGGVAVLFENVTYTSELLRRQETLEGAAEAVAASAKTASIRINLRGLITHIDPTLGAWSGLAIEQIRGLRLQDLLLVEGRTKAREAVERVLTGGATTAFEAELLSTKSPDRPVEIVVSPIKVDETLDGAYVLISA